MDKFKEIRPIVLGVAIKDGKLLVGEGHDRIKNQTFYRCLGGGIEFLEKSTDALRREFKEEIDVDIEVGDFLGVDDNIFTYNGKKAHELVLYYNVDVKNLEDKDEYKILDERNSYAKWVDIDDFKNNKKILYPENAINFI